jgi:hypothetical protein
MYDFSVETAAEHQQENPPVGLARVQADGSAVTDRLERELRAAFDIEVSGEQVFGAERVGQ